MKRISGLLFGTLVAIIFSVFSFSITSEAKELAGRYYEMDEGNKYDTSKGISINKFTYGQSSLIKLELSSTPKSESSKNGLPSYGVNTAVSFNYSVRDESFQGTADDEWHLISDSGKKVNNISGINKKVDMGLIIVQKSADNSTWTTEAQVSLDSTSSSKHTAYTTVLDDLLEGMYYRVTVAYKMTRKTGTTGNSLGIIPLPGTHDVYKTYECVEVYNFYIGYDQSVVKFYDVKTNSSIASGGTTTDGFYVDKCGSNVTITVSGNGNSYTLEDKKTVCAKGNYTITVKTEFGTEYTYTVKVSDGLKTRTLSPVVYEGTRGNYYVENNLVDTTAYGSKSYTSLKIAQGDSSNTFSTNTVNGFDGYGINGDKVYLLLNMSDGKGITYDGWSIISDTWGKKTKETVVGEAVGQVNTGALIIQKSSDGIEWTQIDNGRYADGLFTTDFYTYYGDRGDVCIYSPDGDDLVNGIYLRVYYAYEVQQNGKSSTNKRYLEKYEFYLCSSNLGAVTYHNLSLSSNDIEEIVGDADENTLAMYTHAETLVDGSLTLTGFQIDTSKNQTVSITVKRDGVNVSIPSDKKFTTTGKYEITLVSAVGNILKTTIYVDRASIEDTVERYFGDGFITADSKRIFKEGAYPVFEGGKTKYFINSVGDDYLPVSGTITNTTTGEIINIDPTRASKTGTISSPGDYVVFLTTNPSYESDVHSGDAINYTFRFSIIAEGTAPGPTVNKESLNNYAKSNVADIKPVYYGLTYPSAGKGSITLAFATKDSALNYAYNYEKGMVEDLGDGTFLYKDEIYDSNWELTDALYEYAELAVQKLYIDHTKSYTYLTLKEEDIEACDNLRTLELESSVIVFANEDEKNALYVSEGYPIINNKHYEYIRPGIGETKIDEIAEFQFVHDKYGCDSDKVVIIDSDGYEYPIEYRRSVEEQLREQGCPTGIITIVETTIYGDSTTYQAVYYSEEINNSITKIIYKRNGEENEAEFSYNSDEKQLYANAFTVSGIVDELDPCCLIYIKDSLGNEYYYSALQTVTDYFVEVGTYSIRIINRMGYYYDFQVIIDESEYVRISIDGNGAEDVKDIITFAGQENISLPVLERAGYTFKGYIDSEGNEYWDNIPVVSNESIELTVLWEANTYKISFVDPEGNLLDSMDVVFGYEYELPIISVDDDEEFNGWMIDGEYIGASYIVNLDHDVVMVADIKKNNSEMDETIDEVVQDGITESNADNAVIEAGETKGGITSKRIIILVCIVVLAVFGVGMVGIVLSNKKKNK